MKAALLEQIARYDLGDMPFKDRLALLGRGLTGEGLEMIYVDGGQGLLAVLPKSL